VNEGGQSLSLAEATARFLVSLSPETREISQQAVYKFARWCGRERPFAEFTAPDIASYVERLSLSDTDYMKKLELIRDFLIYAKKQGWTKSNLALHLKIKKGKHSLRSSSGWEPAETVYLTRQGYAKLEAELATLKKKRPQIIDEMRKAAADKDFRENAPLAAAREQRGYLEGRIRELEETLKLAAVLEGKQEETSKISVGDSVLIKDMASGEEMRYTLVNPKEVDPNKSKISSASPIGKAIIGRSQGEVIEVTVPAGKLCYQIKQIGC